MRRRRDAANGDIDRRGDALDHHPSRTGTLDRRGRADRKAKLPGHCLVDEHPARAAVEDEPQRFRSVELHRDEDEILLSLETNRARRIDGNSGYPLVSRTGPE